MKRKCQSWVETLGSAQSLLQNLIFGNSGETLRKSRYQRFLVVAKSPLFSYFLQGILSLIVCKTETLLITCPSLFQTSVS